MTIVIVAVVKSCLCYVLRAVNTASPIHICIVEKHTLLRAGFKMLLKANPDFEVVGEAANREEALLLGAQTRPQVFLVDIDPGRDTAPAFVKELLAISPGAHALVLTSSRDAELLRRCVENGADGFISIEDSPEVLLRAIKKIHDGEVWLPREMVASLVGRRKGARRKPEDPDQTQIALLTQREREVAILIATGIDRKQAAKQLDVSLAAIRNHLTSIFAKLKVSSQYELVFYAQRHGLVKTPSR